MFRALVVLLEIALLVTVLQTPFAQYLFKDVQNTVTQWFITVSEIPEKRQLSVIREDANKKMGSLRPFQQNYLNEVTASRSSVSYFHHQYCKGKEINPYINGQNLSQFCSVIQQSTLLDVHS
ncbi:hypothetical protein [Alteromonas sp. ASW11-130]|uniref:hypothetical protein n=1 Tax=Alteromonas sp. ASW11-130 TaxID=3015775 RepID=UPI0022419D3F|nr:hypothetical protein [Alteromonas sp. ASW11-130]MCW8090522.1 hypothetical protein [Alteromonas sp. ASW11-130]